ncbi:entericidin A/B family lipoprotein [Thiolapillus brandeum]|uniref:Entericidin EcnAB n=1 Tax=Thiolapillus brandeum TaxID=1076588 RepID=A0A7U6GJW1_9GAMM|nr:entericidin A/B family lipoprotein [Thiolapillus brandeum]BAO45033.1 entericidin EcnAB [Thiolapillus brandeum]
MKKIIIVTTLLSLVSLLNLSGCSTMEGVGKDIQKGGEAIEKTAKKH